MERIHGVRSNIQQSKGGAVKTNDVDAAIAQVVPGAVDSSGALLDIGPLSSNVLSAVVGQSVQKSGRTTGHTVGSVAAIGVTVDVGYSTSCGGASNQIARFVNQIRISDGSFSDSGDSGSLVVEAGSGDPANGLPRAVGLLFAGDSSSTLANPIQTVLDAFGVSMVGGTPPPPSPTGSVAGSVTSAEDGSPIAGASVSSDTGQSATTDASGAYTIADLPEGTRTISVTASGFEAASQAVAVAANLTSTANFSLAAVPVGSQIRVECVTFTGSGGKNSDRNVAFSVRVVDDLGRPVAGAIANISVTLDGAGFGAGTGAITDGAGQVTYEAKNSPNGTYVVTVTAVEAAGLDFDGTTPANSFNKGVDASPASFCADGANSAAAPANGNSAKVLAALAAKNKNSDRLFGVDGVRGHGVGVAGSEPIIEVYLERGHSAGRIPASLDGIEVRIVETDGFVAY